MNPTERITVMLGGPSAEREVSLRSGAAVVQALRSRGYSVDEVDPVPGKWMLPPRTQAVFLALHGTYGEDGTVQAELERLGVPYTGCDVDASVLGFDKAMSKARFTAAGIPTAPSCVFSSAASQWPGAWKPPVVLKPVRQGSSVGLQFVDRIEDFPAALAQALRHDHEALMEERILGRETTVGILGGRALPVLEVRPRQGVYDYHNKYTPGATEYLCPAPFDAAVISRIQAAALAAFHAIGGRDCARVDIMVREDGSPVVLEVNTLPGMTATSLYPKAAAVAGIDFAGLCQRMLELAMQRRTH